MAVSPLSNSSTKRRCTERQVQQGALKLGLLSELYAITPSGPNCLDT